MIHFMLYDLHCPAGVGFHLCSQLQRLILNLDDLIAFALTGASRSDRQLSSVSYTPSFLIISGLNITVYVGARPLLSRKAMMRLRTLIIFAAIPPQLSLCAISVSSRSLATYRSSFVATSDFPARKMGSCISSLIIVSTAC